MMKYEGGIMSMTEKDFGITFPMTIVGGNIKPDDSIEFVIKKGEQEIITKSFTNIQNNKIGLVFTKEDSEKLPVGSYTFRIDWFKENVFMNNIKSNEIFEVKAK